MWWGNQSSGGDFKASQLVPRDSFHYVPPLRNSEAAAAMIQGAPATAEVWVLLAALS